MWAVTRSIKFQNKLAKEAIINALKSRSKDMFQDGEMIIRAFTNVTENSIEIFHLFKNKDYVNKQRAGWTNQFGKIFEKWEERFHLLKANVRLNIPLALI